MTGAEFTIVEAPSSVDWSYLRDLLHKTYAYMDDRIDPPSSLHRLSVDDLAAKAAHETLIIAQDDSGLIGCMFCRRADDWLYVGKVAVAGQVQGQGVGRRLFDQAFDLARRMQCGGLELETRVELVENHRTFERIGFVKIGEDAHAGYDQATSIRMRAPI